MIVWSIFKNIMEKYLMIMFLLHMWHPMLLQCNKGSNILMNFFVRVYGKLQWKYVDCNHVCFVLFYFMVLQLLFLFAHIYFLFYVFFVCNESLYHCKITNIGRRIWTMLCADSVVSITFCSWQIGVAQMNNLISMCNRILFWLCHSH